MANDDGDITLGPGKLLGLFFMLVAICGVFFAIGYSLGKTSAREQAVNDRVAVNASLGAPAVTESSAGKPSAVVVNKNEPQAAVSEDQVDPKQPTSMTFYNAVKKSDGTSQPLAAGAPEGTSAKPSAVKAADPRASQNTAPVEVAAAKPPAEVKATALDAAKPVATAGGSYVVQIVAVSREERRRGISGCLAQEELQRFRGE